VSRPTDIRTERVIGSPSFSRDYRRFQIFVKVPPGRAIAAETAEF
jgi:hypothetical protein